MIINILLEITPTLTPNVVEQTKNVIDWYKLISDFGPTIIAALSIFLSYKLAKENYKSEISKIKINSTLEECISITDDLLNLLEEKFANMKSADKTKYLKSLQLRVCVYGSKNMIKIFAYYNQFTFTNDLMLPENNAKQFALFCLMWIQMKYDISNQYVDPMDYLRLKVTDYSKQQELIVNIKKEMKIIINDLKLDREFNRYIE